MSEVPGNKVQSNIIYIYIFIYFLNHLKKQKQNNNNKQAIMITLLYSAVHSKRKYTHTQTDRHTDRKRKN